MSIRDFLPFVAKRAEQLPTVGAEQRIGSGYVVSPYSTLLNPAGWYPNTSAGTSVNDYSVLSVAAAWRCVNLIADSIAGYPLEAWRKDEKLDNKPSLLAQLNSLNTNYETVFSIVVSLLLRGNAYLLPFDFNALGFARQVMVIHPDLVSVRRDTDTGSVVYQVVDANGNSELLHHSEVVHLKLFVFPGWLTGLGVIEAQREGLGHAMALQEYGSRFYAEGAVPTGLISVEEAPSPEELEAFKRQWISMHGSRRRTPAILSGGADYKPISFTPEDSQFLQSRQHSLGEVALMFGVPGHFVGAPGSSMTYTNVEQEGLNLIKYTLKGPMSRIEQALSGLLPRGTDVKFNFDAALRTDTKSRYEAHQIGITAGFLTIDEARCMEGLPELPEQPEPPTDMALEGETTDTTNPQDEGTNTTEGE